MATSGSSSAKGPGAHMTKLYRAPMTKLYSAHMTKLYRAPMTKLYITGAHMTKLYRAPTGEGARSPSGRFSRGSTCHQPDANGAARRSATMRQWSVQPAAGSGSFYALAGLVVNSVLGDGLFFKSPNAEPSITQPSSTYFFIRRNTKRNAFPRNVPQSEA